MDADRYKIVRQVFLRVAELDDSQRGDALRGACGDDSELRREVQELLDFADRRQEGVLDEALAISEGTAGGSSPSRPSSRLDAAHGRFLPGQMLGHRYRIVGLLGRGGMGEVYRADDLELSQSVALKFLPEGITRDPAAIERLRGEVRVAREVSHASVCRVFDIATVDQHVFLTMEHVDGEDLAHVLQRLGRPSAEKALDIARQICAGVAAAHQSGVLHRDLKPANIMIDGRGRVRITDFGLAGLVDDLAARPERAGTVAYMAPEQITEGAVSVRSDLYSLGLLLYELFTGRPAFVGETVDELLANRASRSVTAISNLVQDIDPAVERVISRCLEKDPEKRPGSAFAVVAALPGADPLAAALAAGETPSPELIVHAADSGGLRPGTGAALLAGVVVSLIVTAWCNASLSVFPSRSPATLSVLAEQAAQKLGLVELPPNGAVGFQGNALLENRADYEARGPRPAYRFWRRWSDQVLMGSDFHYPGQIWLDDPPRTNPGEISVVIDPATGHLLELLVVPRPHHGSPARDQTDWHAVLSAAGIDPSRAREVPGMATDVPAFCGEVRSWEIDVGDGTTYIVAAGAHRNRPVFFRQQGMSRAVQVSLNKIEGAAMLLQIVLFLVVVIVAAFNLRHGRSDRRSAFRVAVIMTIAYSLIELVAAWASGISVIESFHALAWLRAGGHVLLHGAQVWVIYIAVEPLVRRVWPQMLGGWVRVLSGEFRDPAVGRELLAGVLAGCSTGVIITGGIWIEQAVGGAAAIPIFDPFRLAILAGYSQFFIASLYAVSGGLLIVMFFVASLFVARVAMRILFRRPNLGTPVGILWISFVLHQVFGLREGSYVALLVPLVIGMGFVLLCTRQGLLSGLIMLIVSRFMATPISPDLAAWHAGWSGSVFVTILTLAGIGFWTAIAGQPILRGLLDEDLR